MSTGKKPFRFTAATIFIAIFIGAPMVGSVITGHSPATYLEFPPRTEAAESVPFYWPLFIGFILFTVLTTWPFFRRMVNVDRPFSLAAEEKPRQDCLDRRSDQSGHVSSFPFWGWLSLVSTLLFWALIWSRLDVTGTSQRLLFFPLWGSFIILLNAVSHKLSGRSLLTESPLFLGLLFPVSALFWWTFEYLNRFVNNWHYVGIGELSGGQYFLEATLAFSTVIPAVMSIRYILLQFRIFKLPFHDFPSSPWLIKREVWMIAGIVSVSGLILLGVVPNLLYALNWILPGILWISWQKTTGQDTPVLAATARGDYTIVWSSACAALICGFFWEMWNMHSAAKWVYSVPGVDRFHIFEMPLIGYAGYLPFGVICALISHSLLNSLENRTDNLEENVL